MNPTTKALLIQAAGSAVKLADAIKEVAPPGYDPKPWIAAARKAAKEAVAMANRPAPLCEACGAPAGDCCAAAKSRGENSDSLRHLVDRQRERITADTTALAEVTGALEVPGLERILERYVLTDYGTVSMNMGAPGSVARQAQEDVAQLVRALVRARKVTNGN